MKLYRIFNGRFPSEKAAAFFEAKSAESFSSQGIEVILLVPRRFKRIKESYSNFYGIKNNFKVIFLPTIDLAQIPILNKISFYVGFVSFSIFSFIYLLFTSKKEDFIYSNESLPLFFISFISSNTLLEIHDFPEKKILFYKTLFKRLKFILATNFWKKEELKRKFFIDDKKIICEPNAVELQDFDINLSKKEARHKLNLPENKFIILYTGHLYSWKGADVLANSSVFLSDEYLIVFVGGTDNDLNLFKSRYGNVKNIFFAGYRNHEEIPIWQKASDVLILPNTAKEDISKFYTSPMKLFEYLASRIPVVASDLPSIRQVAGEKELYFFNPDDSLDLSNKIKWVYKNYSLALQTAGVAYESVQKYSWAKRAKRILGYIFP